MSDRRLLSLLVLVVGAAFAVLGFFGREVYRQAPPIPAEVRTPDGAVLMDREDILAGQEVWQSIGWQQVGSVWGHGAYQAPDWSADWLHREAMALLDGWARAERGVDHAALDAESQAGLQARLRAELRTNTLDPDTGVVTVSAARAAAIASVAAHYTALFSDDPALSGLREAYAIAEDPVPDAHRRELLADFFFWTAWAASTDRPGQNVTYTNNWPHEPLIGNVPTSTNLLWSALSVLGLLAGVGALVWWQGAARAEEPAPTPPAADPLDRLPLTPSMRALWKYAAVVVGLFALQVLLGAATAHYTVEGQDFYGLPLGRWLPYAVTRTWHIQSGLFWIATGFLTFGLFLAPALGGREPAGQRFGVNLLYGALLVVVLGSFAGEWARVQQLLPDGLGFWLGHRGYEYVELGRLWQIALFGGLNLWLFLVLRAVWPALRTRGPERPLLYLLAASVLFIGLLYGSGLFFGARTHLSIMEYWRWWVVHLWVEGFFEVFATASLAVVFHRMGLVGGRSATRAVVISTALYLGAGIPGTFHHLYFSGTPTSVLAVGAAFSALEVMPLVLVGHEAWQNARYAAAAPWMARYRWPLRLFTAVALWNLVGAGLFGFLINPPVALFYLQGLNTTPVHGHTSLFGVYGFLALGLVLLVLRRLRPEAVWSEGALRTAFWGLNLGLGAMVAFSLLPVGLIQGVASVEHGLWYARSAELLQQPLMQSLRWARMVGDTIFGVGAGALVVFAARLARAAAAPAIQPMALGVDSK